MVKNSLFALATINWQVRHKWFVSLTLPIICMLFFVYDFFTAREKWTSISIVFLIIQNGFHTSVNVRPITISIELSLRSFRCQAFLRYWNTQTSLSIDAHSIVKQILNFWLWFFCFRSMILPKYWSFNIIITLIFM